MRTRSKRAKQCDKESEGEPEEEQGLDDDNEEEEEEEVQQKTVQKHAKVQSSFPQFTCREDVP
jgi:hypothetical protein